MLWTSKIVETAKALGGAVKSARTVDKLEALCRTESPGCVILDLCIPEIDPEAIVRRVRALAPGARFVGFGRHTDVEGLDRARAAGCDPVLARSQLQQKLPEYVRGWLA
jgi:DNA-binding NarL/FixJ family response regulator